MLPALLLTPVFAPMLAGCGLHPVYAPATGGAPGVAATALAQIAVGLIPERSGQLLRLALQERFERAGVATTRRYDLSVAFAIAAEALAIQPDSTATRLRLIGTANYTLTAQDATRSTLTSGVARSADGMNLFDQQYFAADLESEVMQRRIAEAVADQIALRLAAFFAAGGSAKAGTAG